MRYVLLVGALALGVLAYVGGWFYLAGEWRDAVAAWAAGHRAEGGQAGYASLTSSGFPFRLILTMEQPQLTLPEQPANLAWEGGQLAALTHPWTPDRVLIDFSGQHRVAFDAAAGQRRHVVLTLQEARASYRRDDDGRPQRLSVAVAEGSAELPGEARRASSKALELHLRPSPRPDAMFDLAASGKMLQALQNGTSVTLRPIETASLQATLTGRLPEDAASVAAAVARWSADGGTLEVTELALHWGELRLRASGSLALDDALRPIGALTAKLRGHRELLRMLVRLGEMRAKEAETAGDVLDVLAAANGGELSVPVRLQDGRLYIGPVMVARLSPLFPPDSAGTAPREIRPQ